MEDLEEAEPDELEPEVLSTMEMEASTGEQVSTPHLVYELLARN